MNASAVLYAILGFVVLCFVVAVLSLLPTVVGVTAFFTLAIGVILFNRWADTRLFPVCRNGKCRANDYQIIARPGPDGELVARQICNCGDIYLKEHQRFFFVQDEKLIPYKRQRWSLSEWVDDLEPEDGGTAERKSGTP